MARLARVSPARVPVHVIQRGSNRQVCFASEEDYVAYMVGWLNVPRNIMWKSMPGY
ncbi:hypothetical protein [Desulfogranum japonicum]|uniref:hypothetical protein n=1 Tax=Desulfogranum japonicum TaxID=231447 RepID=UPI000426FBA3|nr:hypothetical protein [Desulfogranum japonicum]